MIPKMYAVLALDEAELLHKKAETLRLEASIPFLDPDVAGAKLEASEELFRRVGKICLDARRVFHEEEYSFLDTTRLMLDKAVQVTRETRITKRGSPMAPPVSAPPPPPKVEAPKKPRPAGGEPDPEAVYTLGADFDEQDWKAGEARKWYEEAARLGHPRAAVRLALIHAEGRGVKQDYAKARSLFESAATKGLALAEVHLGRMSLFGQGVPPNLLKADQVCERAQARLQAEADAGDLDASLLLAWMLLHGMGIFRDPAKAVEIYRRAAEAGSLAAQTELGLLYDQGVGVQADRHQAVHWLLRAAEQGYAPAQAHYGEIHDVHPGRPAGPGTDFKIAREWYEKAAAQGHPRAKYRLGLLLMTGREGSRDEKEAVRLWKDALDYAYGPLRAMVLSDLGTCYQTGTVVEKDLDAAARHWRESAEGGNRRAQQRLGWYYETVAGDAHEAAQWYFLAARSGCGISSLALGDMCREGRGVPKDLGEAERWYVKAVEQGNAAAAPKLEGLRKSP